MFDLSWNDKFSVDNKVIDGQHKELLTIFDKAHQLIGRDSTSIEIIELIAQLTKYTIFHFHEEEKMMQAAGYKDYKAHVVQHEFFVEKVKEFQQQISSDNTKLKEDVLLFLAEWFVNHIQSEDQKYKDCI